MLAALFALLSLPLVVVPCDPGDDDGSSKECSLVAEPVGSSVSIDGSLDESAWDKAPGATDFRQLEPREGDPASQRTVVRVLYGEDALYVGATLHDQNPGAIQARLARRDQKNQADWFEVSLDSFYDQKTARTFAVNAAGVQRDGLVQLGFGDDRGLDTSWDAIWRSEVQITNEGWNVELRIPYSELRFSEADLQTWGVHFRRLIPRNSEISEWPLIPASQRRRNLIAEYGSLTDLRGLHAERNVRVAPYTVGRVQTSEDSEVPGTRAVSSSYDAGADIELGLGPNSTLNATINPDFGQVESDPAVLNLSAFETFFPEKRPFFVQGTDVFDFRLGRRTNLLYTRRIGARAPVIGALKLTGRSQNGLVYGTMGATTGHDFSPNRNFGVGRLRQDIGSYSTIGAMMTAFDGPSSDGRQRSFAGGMDWDLRFGGNSYQFEGYLSGTHLHPTDPTTTPTTGLAANGELGRIQGDWTYNTGFTLRDDKFDPNDVGRMRENNFFQVDAFVNRQFNGGQPFGPFQRASGFVYVNQSWSYAEGLNRGMGLFSRVEALTEGFRSLSLHLNGDHVFGGYDLFETRGLWPRSRPRKIESRVSLSTDTRREWNLKLQIGATPRGDGGQSWSTNVQGEWNVGSRLKLSGKVSYEHETDAVEWASNESFLRQEDGWAIGSKSTRPRRLGEEEYTALDSGNDRLANILADVAPAPGSDTYYVPVYGARDTERLNFTLRSNVTLTRNLSVQFFGQLFAARGRYDDFQILSSRDDFDSFSAYPKRHDFATSSFLTNSVLRWEFRPGSELFVVWSQDRKLNRDNPFFYDAQDVSPYEQSTTARLTDAFDDFARNAFIVKLRYTFY